MIWKLTILGNRCLHCWPQHISRVNNALEETSTFDARSNEPLTFQSLCQHPCITLTCCNTPIHYPLSSLCPVCLDPYRLVRGRNKWFEDDLAKMRERRWWEWPALCIKTKPLAGRSRARLRARLHYWASARLFCFYVRIGCISGSTDCSALLLASRP